MVSPFRRIQLLTACFLVLTAGPCAFAGKEYRAGPHEQVVPGQLLVGVQLGADIGQILSAIAPQASATSLVRGQGIYLLNVPAGIQAAVSQLLAAHPLVNFVEPNRIRNVLVNPPNDPSLTTQWSLTAVHAPQAWGDLPDTFLTAATAGTNRVKVAILDTGIDCTHPDFMNAGGTSTDSASGGQILWSASVAETATTISNPACAFEDDYGHGTHVAGIVAAATNNATGVASLGYALQLVIFKVSDNGGNATDATVSRGIDDAVAAGVQVISMSLGGQGYSQTMQSAMDWAWQNNVLVVAAAGNFGDTELIYPGDGNHVLGVAATDSNSNVASFSNYGNWVRIAAPGVGVLSTLPTYSGPYLCCNYGPENGTSMATPHVSALAGLLYAANPGISAAAVAQRIQRTAQSPNTGWDQHIGYGIINAAAALENVPGAFTKGALTGQVMDSLGNPITGAVVTATGGGSFTTAKEPITGAFPGLFRINLSPGTYPVTVTANGHTSVNTQATIVAGADTMLTLQMDATYGTFNGMVTFNGVGVAGAVVEVVSNSLIAATTVTDSSGNYSVTVPPGTSYTLTASDFGYINTTSGSHSLSTNGTVTVNLALAALGNITGTVTDLNGVPVSGAHLDFASSSYSGGTTTGSNGTYATSGLPAGTYTVTASASGYSSEIIGSVGVTANTSTLVNFQFSTGISLTSGLAGYWPFNEGTGSVGSDQSGNSYDASLTSNTWTTGLFYPNAVAFTATQGYARTPSIPFTGPLSASVWVNSAATQVDYAPLMQSYSPSIFFLGVDQSASLYKFVVNSGHGSTGSCAYNYVQSGCAQGGTIATGWHLVTGTYDGTTAILYVDGVQTGSDTFTSLNGSSSVQFGGEWGGSMQSARLYNRALTQLEVTSLYTQGTAASLTLAKAADAATVPAGNAIGYTLTANSTGTTAAQSAVLSDPLPTGSGLSWSISPAYSGPGTCNIAGGTLSCSFGDLTPGASASVHISSATSASSCGVYANTGTASAGKVSSVQASASTTVQCSQTINFAALPNQPLGTPAFGVSATASSGLLVSFASLTGPVCTVSGSTVTLVTLGTCTIEATQSGGGPYLAAVPVDQSFTVTKEAQTIMFGGLADKVFGSGTFTVSATASSGLGVSFNSQTGATCSVVGSTVTLVTVGLCTVQATQAGDTNWAIAAPVNQSFSITQGTQSITFGNLVGKAFGSGTFTVSATASSGLAVSFNSQTGATCSVLGSTVTLVAVGLCTVQATQAGDTNWAIATAVNQSFTIGQGMQSITFGNLVGKAFGSGTFTVSGTASSGLGV
ncbi:MAG TPA: S8 family serine peptidase, partial [Bryobacteraceae bacterium]|nr:S8 family serine peptidase [Bryobacteraceae bacterium]